MLAGMKKIFFIKIAFRALRLRLKIVLCLFSSLNLHNHAKLFNELILNSKLLIKILKLRRFSFQLHRNRNYSTDRRAVVKLFGTFFYLFMNRILTINKIF